MASFDFTPLSSSNELDGRFANPSINDTGTVTYEGFEGVCTTVGGDCLQTGTNTPPNAIYTTTSDGLTTKVVDRSSYDGFSGYNSGVFFSASTNNSGTTVSAVSGFNSGQLIAGGPSAVITRTDNGPINNVAYSGTTFGINLINPAAGFTDTGNLAAAGEFASAPSINNAGTVAYIAGHDGTVSLYTKTSYGTTTTIADTSANSNLKDFYLGGVDVQRGKGPFAAYTLPGLNDQGTVAFNADLKSGGKGIFSGNGGTLTTIADTTSGQFTKFSVASSNNNGQVAFDAGLADGGSALYISQGGKLTTLADTNGLFKDLTKSDVALNQKGQVAFLADLDNGTTAIFDGPDPIANKVISVGDKFGDYTVQALFISHDGLNDAGQIAFEATIVDGNGNVTEQIFRADPNANPTPVPEPSSIPLLGVAILGMVAYRWRRRKQFAKQVQH